MADILIRGMEMPSCCLRCSMYTISGCRASKRIFPDWMNVAAVPKDCPLVPLPEGHGRLIDADALERVCKEIADCEWNKKAAPYSWEYAYNQFIDDEIFNAPTVVPAEGGVEE